MDVGRGRQAGARARAGRRARPHQRPGIAEREAVPGHRRDPRSRHRRRLDGQHPASREPERRGLRADGRPRPRDVPRPRAERCRRGRPGRSLPRGAAGPPAQRQGLPRRPGRAGAPQLLPSGQPLHVARARAARGRGGCRGPPQRRRARPAQQAGGGRAGPRPRRAAAALAARPPARLALGPAPRRRDRRAVDAPARAGALRGGCDAARRPPSARLDPRRALPRGGRGRSRGHGAACRPRARLDLRVRRDARRAALGRDRAGIARVAHDPRAARDRHPRRRRTARCATSCTNEALAVPAPCRPPCRAAAPARAVHGEAARSDGARRRAADRAGGGRGAGAGLPPRRPARVQPRGSRPARRARARHADPRGRRARRAEGRSAGRRAHRARQDADRRPAAPLGRRAVRPHGRPGSAPEAARLLAGRSRLDADATPRTRRSSSAPGPTTRQPRPSGLPGSRRERPETRPS